MYLKKSLILLLHFHGFHKIKWQPRSRGENLDNPAEDSVEFPNYYTGYHFLKPCRDVEIRKLWNMFYQDVLNEVSLITGSRLKILCVYFEGSWASIVIVSPCWYIVLKVANKHDMSSLLVRYNFMVVMRKIIGWPIYWGKIELWL